MPRTIGAEEELLLVDIRDGRPRSVAGQVLTRAAAQGKAAHDPQPGAEGSDEADLEEGLATGRHGAVEGELQRQQIEMHTPPVSDLATLADEITHWRAELVSAARSSGASVAALGTSPLPVQPLALASDRYAWIQDRYQLTAREHLTCGFHIHVSVDSDEEGVGVLDRMRVWLPSLLALSANSPFWHGVDSGYASYRSQAMSRWPSAGATDVFGSAPAYHERIELMTSTEVVLDKGMVYYEARLAHSYPTVEIRAADVCLTVDDAVVIAGLGRALVETAARQWAAGEPPPAVPTAVLRLASWQASREGVEGRLLDVHTLRPVPAWSVLDALLEHVGPALDDAGDLERVSQGLATIREAGTGATRQRRTHARTGQLVDVVAQAVRITSGHEIG